MRIPAELSLGAMSAAFSVEGGIVNDWTAWVGAGRGDSGRRRAALPHATPHYWQDWEVALGHLLELGLKTYRFSVDWARVEPAPGQYDLKALGRYRAMTAWLVEHGIQPVVTLLHFSHPPWFHKRCPWHKSQGEAAVVFSRFVQQVTEWLGDLCSDFVILNEPHAWVAMAYITGMAPPGYRRSFVLGTEALSNLMRAHAAAAAVIRRKNPRARIGLQKRVYSFEPDRPESLADRGLARYTAHLFNHLLLETIRAGRLTFSWGAGVQLPRPLQAALKARLPVLGARYRLPELTNTLDFIGLSYQTRVFTRMGWRGPSYLGGDRAHGGVSDDGEELYPQGLRRELDAMAQYGLPLRVCCGLADRDDSRRPAFIYDHVKATLEAIEAGTKIEAYEHRALLDGFEWRQGFSSRWGLYGPEGQPQTASRALLSELAHRRILPPARPEAFPVRRIGGRWRVI